MKGIKVLVCALLLGLLLCACGENTQPTPPPDVDTQQTQTVPEVIEPAKPDESQSSHSPVLLEKLTVELVASWEDSGRILGELSKLSGLLQASLSTQGYEVETVNVTISTAGGITADALVNGGVDAALLPTIDFVPCGQGAAAILTSDEELCTMVAAVSRGNELLDEAFCRALQTALLETEEGAAFLQTYHPQLNFRTAREEDIEAVRQWMAELEEGHGA